MSVTATWSLAGSCVKISVCVLDFRSHTCAAERQMTVRQSSEFVHIEHPVTKAYLDVVRKMTTAIIPISTNLSADYPFTCCRMISVQPHWCSSSHSDSCWRTMSVISPQQVEQSDTSHLQDFGHSCILRQLMSFAMHQSTVCTWRTPVDLKNRAKVYVLMVPKTPTKTGVWLQ